MLLDKQNHYILSGDKEVKSLAFSDVWVYETLSRKCKHGTRTLRQVSM